MKCFFLLATLFFFLLLSMGCANMKQWREDDDRTAVGDPTYMIGAGKLPDGF